jgi:hypothetical protein
MSKYIENFIYTVKHKYYLARECFKLGLYWQGIVHDLDKFYPYYFIKVSNYYGGKGKVTQRIYYKIREKHKRSNKHHWGYWWSVDDTGKGSPKEIPDKYIKEMICDWIACRIAEGGKREEVIGWWEGQADSKFRKKRLHANTVVKIERFLKEII